jgi:hypothetical protein
MCFSPIKFKNAAKAEFHFAVEKEDRSMNRTEIFQNITNFSLALDDGGGLIK